MVIVEPSVEVVAYTQLPPNSNVDRCTDMARVIEAAGRTSWKSEDKQGPGTADGFCVRVVNIKKDESIAEHCSVTVRIVTDRYASHQLVRHRIAAYTQESTHYINYGKEKYEGHIQVCESMGIQKYKDFGGTKAPRELPHYESDPWFTDDYKDWYFSCLAAEKAYFRIVGRGTKHYHARFVLPSCLKTEVVATYNLRIWPYVIALRITPSNTPEIAHIMRLALPKLRALCPPIFDDLYNKHMKEK